jgi:hypothetical protein
MNAPIEPINDHTPDRADLAAAWPELSALALDALDTLTLEAWLQAPALPPAELQLVDELQELQRRLIAACGLLGEALEGGLHG